MAMRQAKRLPAWLVPLVLLLSFGIAGPAPAEDWYKLFASRNSNPRARLFDGTKYSPGWTFAYIPRAYLSAYRARKDTKWLDCLVVRIDNLIEEMRDTPKPGSKTCPTGKYWPGYKDGFKGWGTASFGQYDEFLVQDGHVCVPIARFVKTVYRNPALHKRYKAKADRYLRTLEAHVIAKWHASWNAQRGKGCALRTWGGWRNLPHNMYLAFGTLLLVLHEIAQSPHYAPANADFPPFYLREASAMARFFRSKLKHLQKADAYVWLYMEPESDPRPRAEDVGHANLDIEFAIRAHHLGIVFDDRDMKRFANTVTRVLWNQDERQPEFRSHLSLKHKMGSSYLWRWLWLSEFEPRIGRLISRHYINHPRRAAQCEMCANLACWQAGVREDDYPRRLSRPS